MKIMIIITMMNKVKLGDICNIVTGKLDANQAQLDG